MDHSNSGIYRAFGVSSGSYQTFGAICHRLLRQLYPCHFMHFVRLALCCGRCDHFSCICIFDYRDSLSPASHPLYTGGQFCSYRSHSLHFRKIVGELQSQLICQNFRSRAGWRGAQIPHTMGRGRADRIVVDPGNQAASNRCYVSGFLMATACHGASWLGPFYCRCAKIKESAK